MLTCQQISDKASLIVDGELGFRERTSVRLHLMMCSNCRRFNGQFKALVSSMSRENSTSEEMSPRFVNAVMQSFDDTQKPSPRPPRPNKHS